MSAHRNWNVDLLLFALQYIILLIYGNIYLIAPKTEKERVEDSHPHGNIWAGTNTQCCHTGERGVGRAHRGQVVAVLGIFFLQ